MASDLRRHVGKNMFELSQGSGAGGSRVENQLLSHSLEELWGKATPCSWDVGVGEGVWRETWRNGGCLVVWTLLSLRVMQITSLPTLLAQLGWATCPGHQKRPDKPIRLQPHTK